MSRSSSLATSITTPHSPIRLRSVLNPQHYSPKPPSPMSAKKTSGTMRRSSQPAEIALPITYTPTTHRISKAKKGKRVHACEYPGCSKVFTRAEHRRRHELNHNPEALFRCTHHNCKKAFHRPDLLARHMERHEFEAQMDNSHWDRHSRGPIISDQHYMSKCAAIDANTAPYLATTQQPSSMSIGSIVGPAIHPDLAGDCGMMWNGLHMHSEHQAPMYGSNHIHESVEDTRFYSSPETCSSPSSDGATMSIPSHPRSSLSSTPGGVIDPYPENIIDSDLTSSPMSMHSSNVRCWEQSDASLPSNMVPLSLHENLVQPPLHCQYPSPTWSAPQLSYDEHTLPPVSHFPPTVSWKSWNL